MKTNLFQKLLVYIIGAILLYGSISLMVKTDIGMSPFDAFSLVISRTLAIDYGYATMIVNGVTFASHWLLLKKKFPAREYFQLLLIFGAGLMINFFSDVVFAQLALTNYVIRLLIFVLAIPVMSIGILLMLNAELMSTPIEGMSQTIAKKSNRSLGLIRWLVDGVLVILVIVVTLITKQAWTIGLGTLIMLIAFGPSLDLMKRPVLSFLRVLKFN